MIRACAIVRHLCYLFFGTERQKTIFKSTRPGSDLHTPLA
jgi:hypothetical protein